MAPLLQPLDATVPAAWGPVPALGEDHQRAEPVEPARQPLDPLTEDPLAGPAVADEHVGKAVGHHIEARVELHGRFHDHARPPPVDAQQMADEQE